MRAARIAPPSDTADEGMPSGPVSLAQEMMGTGVICALWAEAGAAAEWKQARMSHQMAWQLPATLVMSVAFSSLFVLPKPDEMNAVVHWSSNSSSTPHGEVAVQICNWLVAHVYVASMMLSGLLSIKSINDFLQDYLAFSNTPAHLLPQYISFRKEWQKERPCKLSHAKRWMRVPSYCGALWASIRYLLIGFLCGVYLLYGSSYAVVPFVTALFFHLEYQRTCMRSFQDARRDFETHALSKPSASSLCTANDAD